MKFILLNHPQWFRDEVSKEDSMPEETLTLLFSHIDPLYELHATFLKVIILISSYPHIPIHQISPGY